MKTNGANCRANARKDSAFCFFHDPQSGAERKAAQRTGGRNRAREIRVLAPDTPDRHLFSNGEISTLIDEMINRVLKGELDPSIVREVTPLVAVRLRLYEASGENDSSLAISVEKLRGKVARGSWLP